MTTWLSVIMLQFYRKGKLRHLALQANRELNEGKWDVILVSRHSIHEYKRRVKMEDSTVQNMPPSDKMVPKEKRCRARVKRRDGRRDKGWIME